MEEENILIKLLNKEESEYLDFKQEYWKNNADVVHDILCMANSRHNGDRYIVLGVEDGTRKPVGITDIKHTQAKIIDLLSNANLNRSLYNDIRFNTGIKYQEKEFAILTIISRPDKPFFLTKDFGKGKETVRAGVVYTRHGDKNTPAGSTALDDEIELMWRQRFGLDLTPLDRFSNYLDDIDNWDSTNTHPIEYYYKPFPEFRVVFKSNDLFKGESWLPEYWLHIAKSEQSVKKEITKTIYDLKYNGYSLETAQVIYFLYHKEFFPLPEITSEDDKDVDKKIYPYKISRNSNNFRIAQMIDNLYKEEDSSHTLEFVLNKVKGVKITD